MSAVLMVYQQHAIELDKTKTELANSKRQCELVKDLLADSTAEKEIMYEASKTWLTPLQTTTSSHFHQAFNEELDGMYNDVNLPDDEAWERLTADLRKTKESRNAINKENSCVPLPKSFLVIALYFHLRHLKRKLAESQSQQDQYVLSFLSLTSSFPDLSCQVGDITSKSRAYFLA